MTTTVWPNGIGASLGDTLGTCKPLSLSGNIWFVSSATGSDSYNGGDEAKPFATLGAAYAAASANDIIVLLSGHTETSTAKVTVSAAGVTIVGTGSSGGKPTCKLKLNAAADNLLVFSGAGCALRNVWIQGNSQTCSTARISVTGSGFLMRDCYVECDQYDTGSALTLGSGADAARIIDTTFISTATSVAAQPYTSMLVGAAIADLTLDGVTLSGGTVGFSDFYAADLSTAAITRLKGESVSLLLGADMRLHASTTGYLNAQTVTGAGKVVW